MADLEAAKPFQGVNLEELENLRQVAQEQQSPAGEQIFGVGDHGDGVYVICDGLVEIAHLPDLKEHRVFSQLGPGEVFGEMAVIEHLPRSASAIAAKSAKVYFIPRDEMFARLKRSPGLAFSLSA